MEGRIKDPSLLLLIRRFLKAGYIDGNVFVNTDKGTPQGSNLSPILSNVYLHYVLDLWFEKVVKPRARGKCYLVRFADDYICLIQYKEDAERIIEAIRDRFAKFELELHAEKTRVLSFGRYERENAKRQNRKPLPLTFLDLPITVA
ncbi:MAG: reverse transcriptase domain-containing protein [bacterium]